jgi:hypothetical protein
MGINKGMKKGNGPTFMDSREETVIDYGIVNEEVCERVEEVRIGETISKKL